MKQTTIFLECENPTLKLGRHLYNGGFLIFVTKKVVTEATSHWRCSIKKSVLKNFLKFSRNCARISFLTNLHASGLQLYYKRGSRTGVFQ